ncbi:MAG TPA: fumarylacetoacetate hydrolase family protein [Acidimicrobiia bacterium]|nr:fumarylacetoacetate hydrolase family protein [Acidimicrobiia bacterium]
MIPPADWQIPAVRAGVTRMLQARSRAIARGERPIGWKLGFGAPAFLEKFGLTGPLVGFLTDAGQRPSGARVPVDGWTRPVAEPEIAAYLGGDVGDPGEIESGIVALGPAIELADIDKPPEDIEEVMTGNIFHRAVILGEPDPARAGARVDGLLARVVVDGEPVATVDEVEELTGRFVEVLRHSVSLLQAANETFRAGDVVILGSVIPPVSVTPGQEVGFEVAGSPAISVRV